MKYTTHRYEITQIENGFLIKYECNEALPRNKTTFFKTIDEVKQYFLDEMDMRKSERDSF